MTADSPTDVAAVARIQVLSPKAGDSTPPGSATSTVMVALRSRRLERLFGTRLDHVTHAQVSAFVTNTVAEAYDLDFKATLYGKSDKERRDLASDVAALANTAGGVIVLGISEDSQARATAAPGVALSDAEAGRVRQIVASQVSPLPTLDVLQVEDPKHPGHGFMLLAVPRSPMGPHAVLVNQLLRFPKRNGATTTYLSEPEVADAYRARFIGIQSRFDDLAQYERDLLDRLDATEQTYVVVTLVPDLEESSRVVDGRPCMITRRPPELARQGARSSPPCRSGRRHEPARPGVAR
jgi:hypothetical protein